MFKTEIATTAERNQIIGHSRADIYEKHYQNGVVNIDIAAAILKTPSRSSLLKSIGHIGLDHDPRVPQTLDQKEKDAVLADPELIQLTTAMNDYRASVPRQAFRDSRDPEKRTTEWRHFRNIQAKRQVLCKKLLKQAIAKKRRQFFANVDNQDIRQSRLGIPITHNPSTPLYNLSKYGSQPRFSYDLCACRLYHQICMGFKTCPRGGWRLNNSCNLHTTHDHTWILTQLAIKGKSGRDIQPREPRKYSTIWEQSPPGCAAKSHQAFPDAWTAP